ncbi:MAG: hypothetical protein K9J17_08540 [Flavobacteriales bacterium]|nr:hypothetical protein [Flavobacteriales bacterium]
MNIEKFVERRLKANVLRFSNEMYRPGIVIDDDDNDRMIGHIADVLGGNPDMGNWAIRSHSANILVATKISGTRKGDLAVQFLQLFGVNIAGNFEHEITFHLEKVTSKDLQEKDLTIEIMLDALREKDINKWRSIKRDFVVTETYYAEEFSVKFHRKGDASAEVKVKAEVDVEASAKVEWETEGTIRVTNNGNVPFAVRGFVVKKPLNDQ